MTPTETPVLVIDAAPYALVLLFTNTRVIVNFMAKPPAVKRTPGQQRLLALTQREGQQKIADQLGCVQQSVSKWAAGLIRPSSFWRKVMAKKLRIAERDWLTEDERAALGEAA